MSHITIYHNPHCSKSRQTMALLEEKNINPEVIEYLVSPPTADQLEQVVKLLNISVRELIRSGEDEYVSMNLADETLTDAELIEAMTKAPKLIQRPIVIANDQARIGRPPESVLEIL